jgi:hypothetical protein
LERWGRIQVIILEGVKVKDARDDGQDVLSESLVERERLLASDCVRGICEKEVCDFNARVGGGSCNGSDKKPSTEQGGQKPRMNETRENHDSQMRLLGEQ